MYNTKMDTIFMISKNSKTDKWHVRRNVISAPTEDEEFQLLDEPYSISNIEGFFNIYLKNMEKKLLIF